MACLIEIPKFAKIILKAVQYFTRYVHTGNSTFPSSKKGVIMNCKRAGRLSKALESLGKGEDTHGRPLDLAIIAARTHATAMKVSDRIRKGQKRTKERFREMHYRG